MIDYKDYPFAYLCVAIQWDKVEKAQDVSHRGTCHQHNTPTFWELDGKYVRSICPLCLSERNPHTCEERIVMYILVRKDLNMSIGKACAQVGHAVEYMLGGGKILYGCNYMHEWRRQGSPKIVLGVKNEKELLKFAEISKSHIVIDSGLTELEPNTKTCLAFNPQPKSTLSKQLKRLQLLK